MYEIESGVQIPSKRRASKYPFERMQVGDSFAVPVLHGADAGALAAALRTSAYAFGKEQNIKFTVRLNEDRSLARVWRVA